MAFPVFLDTCTLFPQTLCDAILTIAEDGVFTPYWSDEVLAAVVRNVVAKLGVAQSAVERRVQLMKQAFPHALVTGYEGLTPAMANHPGDHHVLAACITSPAQTLVTFNVKDFPPASTSPYDIEIQHPDEFLLNQLDLHPDEVHASLRRMLERNKRPPQDIASLADVLRRCHVPMFATQLERAWP